MKKINFIKFALDLAMGITFVLLFNIRVLGGLSFHEIAGLALGFAVLVHIGINWKWVKNVSLSIFNRKMALKTRIGYVLNILLLLDMAVIIISGIFSSKVIFRNLSIQYSFFNKGAHIGASYMALALIGIHIGLHWTWATNVFKRVIKLSRPNKILGYTAKAAAVLVLIFGIYSMASVHYLSNIVQIFDAGFSAGSGHDRGMKPGLEFREQAPNENITADIQQGQGSSGNSKGTPGSYQNRKGGRPDSVGNGKGMGSGNWMGSTNISGTLASYLSIMGVFTVLTYYTEKLLLRRKL